MSLVQIAHNATTAKMVGGGAAVKNIAREALSYIRDEQVGSSWDGRSSFFDYDKETFPAGFVHLIQGALLRKGYQVQLVRKPFPAPLGPERPVVDTFGFDPKYDFQLDVPEKLLKFGQVIAQVATGGGKSRIAKLCYMRIGRPTMFLTTRGILMHQMRDSVAAMSQRERVGVLGDDNWSPNPTGFNVCMVQSLAPLLEVWEDHTELERYLTNREAAEDRAVKALVAKLAKVKAPVVEVHRQTALKRADLVRGRKPDARVAADIQAKVVDHNSRRLELLEFLAKIEFVILEEAHESSGGGYFEVMRACRNANYRLALTATPFMRDSTEANMRLMACSGPVAIRVTEKELIDLGVLAKPYFKFIGLSNVPQITLPNGNPKLLYGTTPWPTCYEIGIVHNDARNNAIVAHARLAAAYGLSCMVLVTHQAHGKLLQSLMHAAGVRSNFIFGEHSQDDRQASLTALKEGRIQTIIGSSILDVGVDVPAVGMIILAGGGKAEVAVRQRIGRGLRSKRQGPNVAFVVDFNDVLNNTLRSHARDRRGIIAGTPGFAENIVGEFNFAALGFRSAA